jgi:hypothetical protein
VQAKSSAAHNNICFRKESLIMMAAICKPEIKKGWLDVIIVVYLFVKLDYQDKFHPWG